MEGYDFIFLVILAVSCFAGFVRGATKELVNLIAFFLSLFIAFLSQPFLANSFHLDTITSFIGAFIIFLLLYFGIRYAVHAISDRVQQQKALNTFDRVMGVGIGILRTLVVLGVIHLLFSLVMPIQQQPHWFRAAKVYPLSVKCAQVLQAFIPAGLGVADKVAKNQE